MTKPADNQPFEFNLDAFVKGMDHAPFRFHWSGRRWEMAHFDAIDSKETKKAVQSGDDDEILKLAMGGEQFAAFDEIPIPNGGRNEMVKQYFRHCGVNVGELLGSTSS
jgi:hypothetical protein